MTAALTPEERKRLRGILKFEKAAYAQGYSSLAGVDEAGRGPLAGPLVVCACMCKKGILIPHVTDSKKLTELKRDQVHRALTEHPDVAFAFVEIDHLTIDQINIHQATMQGMLQAVEKLTTQPDFLLVDGFQLPHPTIPVQKIIEGDNLSFLIAAASIIAKVERDRIMYAYHEMWPEYGFADHKGYSTKAHKQALKKHGPCPIHRRSFQPVKELTEVV